MNQTQVLDRLEDKFTVGDGCWEWTGSRNNYGYGVITIDYKQRLGHRLVYELLKGPIPAGLEIDHLCRNRGCVNPGHLEPVTHAENTLRGEAAPARQARKTHCDKGHVLVYVPSEGCRRCPVCRAEWRRKRRS